MTIDVEPGQERAIDARRDQRGITELARVIIDGDRAQRRSIVIACSWCGAATEHPYRFCSRCGIDLATGRLPPPPAWCTQCGSRLGDADRFCGMCGTARRGDGATG